MNYKNNWFTKNLDIFILPFGMLLLIVPFIGVPQLFGRYLGFLGSFFWIFGWITIVSGITFLVIIRPFKKLTTKDSRILGSRLHRPVLYWLIVAIFLLVSVVMAISFTSYDDYTNPPTGSGLIILHYPAIIVMIYFFIIPSMIGAIRLLHKRKSGFIPSLIALVLFDIPFLAVTFRDYSPWSNYLHWRILGGSMFILDSIMILFLILGLKHAQWESKSDSFQTDSMK